MLQKIEDDENKRSETSGLVSHFTLNTKCTGIKNKNPNTNEMIKKAH